jgi:amino acid transporter
MKMFFTKNRERPLGIFELIAIALGGMVGGGIFAILGISVEKIGNATPIAIFIGGLLALLAAYSYVKLALYYKDEGATYSFYKKTFTDSHFSACAIGWLITFGYISTLALYAFTFSSYVASVFPSENYGLYKNIVAGLILFFFATINLVSVKGMGKLEDIMVYLKLMLIFGISVLLADKGSVDNILPILNDGFSIMNIIIVASITFVAYEGFQLVIHATNEMRNPDKNIPRAIYTSIGLAMLIYVTLSIGALMAIPKAHLIADKEYALAAGSFEVLGIVGLFVVIFGAVLATASAINGTIFGASRLMAVIADDGYFPKILTKRIKVHIPKYSIIFMVLTSYIFILTGSLELIVKFGSITFLLVSLLMAYANFKIRKKTKTKGSIALLAIFGLGTATTSILYFEAMTDMKNLIYIFSVYILITVGAWMYSRYKKTGRL